MGTDCINVISSGEKEDSWDAIKLTSDICQPSPTTSKYKLEDWISSAVKFWDIICFCNKVFDEYISSIVCWTWIVTGEPFKVDSREPLKNILI